MLCAWEHTFCYTPECRELRGRERTDIVIAQAKFLNCQLMFDEDTSTWVGSLINIGALVGSLAGGTFSDRYGELQPGQSSHRQSSYSLKHLGVRALYVMR